ncbi:hypothetical protein PHMEG_0008551 [Phytophthora megakarya]|uniref:Uncharacterized protein n=1 Tax=Phytophthora megakarya TaxID=4795 RepID=A0A225WIV2_9STRA|nr:hypothetical protein PHMEG_0008551 [Phytophthora megakarya]
MDMPNVCWLLNAVTRTCSCRFNSKFDIWVHLIKITQVLALPCSGMLISRFISNQRYRGSNIIRDSDDDRIVKWNLPLLSAKRFTISTGLCSGRCFRYPTCYLR